MHGSQQKRIIDDQASWSLSRGPRNAALESKVSKLEEQLANVRIALASRDLQLEALRQKVMLDEVTGLPDERAFEAALAQALGESRRYRRPCALLRLTLDDLEPINLELGHIVGDRLLAHVAALLKRGIRESDVLARTGVGAFGLLLREMNEEQRMATARRLAHTVSTQPYRASNVEVAPAVSVGGCMLSEARTRMGLLQLTDQRMKPHALNGEAVALARIA